LEEIAKQKGQPILDFSCVQANEQSGMVPTDVLEISTAKIAFPRVPQKVWLAQRSDNQPGNHFYITQIPFDMQVDQTTGFACIYHIFIQFEKTIRDYSSKEITEMTLARFEQMDVQLGDILEPIAALYSAKEPKAWNGLIKAHLKTPTIDGHNLLSDTRVFALILDGELQKISKGYVNTAFNKQLTITTTGETLKNMSAHEVPTDIVETSFRRGQEFEITQVRKAYKDSIAYLIAASLE
jgi:hypothetical protein